MGIRSESTEVLSQLCAFVHTAEGETIRAITTEGSEHTNPSQLSLELNPNVGSQFIQFCIALEPSDSLVLIISINIQN